MVMSRGISRLLSAVVSIFLTTFLIANCGLALAQDNQPQTPIDLEKYPGLLPAFGHLVEKLQHDVQFPALRAESQLLPLLPASTNFYMAIPNYGDATRQATGIFQQALEENASLRNWWETAKDRPKILDALQKFSSISQYLGDEIVIAGDVGPGNPKLVILAQIRKPGLREVLQPIVQQLSNPKDSTLQLLGPKDLARFSVAEQSSKFLVLVTPDLLIASSEPGTLLTLANTTQPSTGFRSTAFGGRISEAYTGGVSTVGALDLQKFFTLLPNQTSSSPPILQLTGFNDVKYLVWNRTTVNGHSLSQAELSFKGPRRSVASWLAPPTTLNGLDFVSKQPLMAVSLALKDPALVFADLREVIGSGGPNALAGLAQTERGLGISLQDDLFAQLTGEITLELDNIAGPKPPSWKAIVQLRNPGRMQQTLAKVFTATHVKVESMQDGELNYQIIHPPSPKGDNPIDLAFVDNYLLITPSADALKEAVLVHRSDESLAKSNKFLAALPPGRTGMSAVWYQDPTAMMALQMQRLAPELAASIAQARGEASPMVMCLYGEENAILEASTNPGLDVSATLMVAAIAIPNLLRSRIAANEASAVGSMRTINVAQVTYAITYPERGFSRDLASLGSRPSFRIPENADHAGLLDDSLAHQGCTAGKWCEKSGYRFTVSVSCRQLPCKQYVSTATPISSRTGGRNFCSSMDGIIRMKAGKPLTAPLTLSECRAWEPLR